VALVKRSQQLDECGVYFGRDTSPEAESRLVEFYRSLTPAEKLQKVAELNATTRALAAAGIRARHGGQISGQELTLRLASLRLDRQTMRDVFGWDPEVEGY
jgi:hypothetical protein